MRAAPLLAFALALASAGCSRLGPREAVPLPPERPGAAAVGVRVEGVVIDRFGYAVPDAWVTVRVGSPTTDAGDPECAGATHLPTRTRSAPTGEFAVVIEAGPRQPFLACLEIEALPPPAFGLRENTVIVPSAAFTTAGAAGSGAVVSARIVLF